MLCAKRGLAIAEHSFASLESCIPPLLTPGAAEALVMKVYRQVRTSTSSPDYVFRECLTEYQNPIPPDVMEFQIQLAVSEASALEFVPRIFRRKPGP
jgi:hypothetical protein